MWRTRLIRRGADTEQPGPSAGRIRREVYVTSGLGVLLVGGVLGVGTVFAPADGVPVQGAGADGGSALRLPDAPASRSGSGPGRTAATVTRTVPTDLVASAAPTGGAPDVAAPPAGSRAAGDGDGGRDARGTTRRERADAGIGGGSSAGTTGRSAGSGAADAAPATGTTAGEAASAAAGAGTQTVGADATQSRVRLRVNTVSVTGTSSGTLQPGAQVRLRMTTAPEGASSTTDAPATPDAAASSAVPETLDVRLGLDEKAVARLNAAAAEGSTEALALQAKVDLVSADKANATTTTGLSVRVRMRVTSTGTPQALSTREHDGDGVSNVVEVTAPLGRKDADVTPGEGKPTDGAPTAPQDGTTTPTPAPETAPVEVVLPISTQPSPAQGGEGAKVDVPLPDAPTSPDPSTPAAGSAGVDVEVHVPTAGEPIGGTPVIVVDPTPTTPTLPEGPGTPTPALPDGPATPGLPDGPDAAAPEETPAAGGETPAGDDAATGDDAADAKPAGDDATTPAAGETPVG